MLGLLDDLTAWVWSVRRKSLESFLLPAAELPGGVILARDNSLVTLVAIAGSRSATGTDELDAFVERTLQRWNTPLLERGHALHAVFERDPGAASLGRFMDRQARAARDLGLALDDVLAERARHLADLLSDETIHLACWTRPSLLTPDQERRDRRQARRRLKNWLPAPSEAASPLASYESLGPRHDAFVDGVLAGLAASGIAYRRLETHEALAAIRALAGAAGAESSHPETADPPPRATDPAEAGWFPPPLATQILTEDPVRDGPFLALGDRRWAPVDMVLGPRAARPFAELMTALADAGIPCRWSLLVEGGGMATLGAAAARIAAAFLAFSSDESRAVRDSLQHLQALRSEARAVVRLRLSCLTWTALDAPASETHRRAARLQQIVESWGEIVATRLTGDPLETFAGTIPGFACGATAEPAIAPLNEALRLMPVSRPAALAPRRPNHLFRSPDGRMLPFSFEEAGDYGFDLIYGIPGRGKSVLMNALALAWSLQSGQTALPLTAVIDIGPSSSGLISLIREALPAQRRHEAGWFRLTMSRDHAINPFDTQLGCRRPLAPERQYLANLLSLILTPAGAAGVPDGAREMIGPVIDAAFAMRSDERAGNEPNAYTPGRDAAVDSALAAAGCRLPADPAWWDVVDALFDAGATPAAAAAQRFAVPLLSDLASAVRQPSVQALVARATWGASGETVTEAFIRILTGAADAWPIFFHPTAFDSAGARVAAIDLREVAPTGSAEADRQTAAVYMLARHALTRHWWIDEEAGAGGARRAAAPAPPPPAAFPRGPPRARPRHWWIDEEAAEAIPERYRDWHRHRLRAIREAPKRLAYDEFHRASRARAVVDQVERDIRETRKLRVTVSLASQRLEDFSPALVELANRIWVLGAGGKRAEITALASLFDLSETLQAAVRNDLTGPSPGGAPALLIATDGGGRIEQVVVNSPGPAELWALTTSPRDVALRARLYQAVAPAEARSLLARAFPAGTAASRIEAELAAGRRIPEAEVLDRLARELTTTAAAM